MRSEFLFIILAGSMMAARVAHAQVDYTAPGPEAFTTTDFANGTAGSLGGKLVVPNRAGKYPLLVNTHGFSGNADQQIGWGEHFASYGFVAVVPSMPGGLPPDHKANGDVVRALALYFSDPNNATPAQGKVDAERIGLSGHSAGGLWTTFAAAQLKPRATVLFDPVDNAMMGRPVYATICSPVMAIFAEPGSCNNQSDWSTFKTTSIGPQILLDVIGSNHCDPINPLSGAGCDLLCGGVSSLANQANYSRRATAFFLAMLKDDAAAAATLTASALAADTALRNTSVRDAPNCAVGPSDGGADASADAATPPDGTTSPDVATPTDAVSSDSAVRDVPTTSDAPPDLSTDARSEAGSDVSTPSSDASGDAAVDAAPPIDAAVSDASTGTDVTAPPPKDSGAPPSGGNATESSGCNCTLVAERGAAPTGGAATLLLGMAAIGRRMRRGRRRIAAVAPRPR